MVELLTAVLFLAVTGTFFVHNISHPPHGVELSFIVGLSVVFILFVTAIFKEQLGDERERQHARSAGRISYLIGVGLLVIGIIYQALTGQIDTWLIVTLVAMLLSKIISIIYLRARGWWWLSDRRKPRVQALPEAEFRAAHSSLLKHLASPFDLLLALPTLQ